MIQVTNATSERQDSTAADEIPLTVKEAALALFLGGAEKCKNSNRFVPRLVFGSSGIRLSRKRNGPQRSEAIEVEPAASTEGLRLNGFPATLLHATGIRRKRGPSLSRRIGQHGNVFQHTKAWNPAAPVYGRYWIDVPGGERKRRTVALGVCGTRSVARRKLREHIEAEGINATQTFTSSIAPTTTFCEQAASWIQAVSTRRRKPVKPATICGWQHALNRLLPNLGDMPLANIGNATLKAIVDNMVAAGLSAQTIVTYSKVVKMVVASAVNSEGEQIHPRKWNHDFIGLPVG